MKLKNKRTGEIVEAESCNSTTGTIGLFFAEGRECDRAYNSLAELCEEWEDVLEEPKEYWLINDFARPEKRNSDGYEEDFWNKVVKKRKEIGNYFETEEEAEKAVEKLKAWKRLEDKCFRFVSLSLEPDKYSIEFDFNGDKTQGSLRGAEKDIEFLFGGEE